MAPEFAPIGLNDRIGYSTRAVALATRDAVIAGIRASPLTSRRSPVPTDTTRERAEPTTAPFASRNSTITSALAGPSSDLFASQRFQENRQSPPVASTARY